MLPIELRDLISLTAAAVCVIGVVALCVGLLMLAPVVAGSGLAAALVGAGVLAVQRRRVAQRL